MHHYTILDVELSLGELVCAEEGAVGGDAAADDGQRPAVESAQALVLVEEAGGLEEAVGSLRGLDVCLRGAQAETHLDRVDWEQAKMLAHTGDGAYAIVRGEAADL